jgi:hypothetical protein
MMPIAKWRTARVAHRCDRQLGMGLRCRNWTVPGEAYWDTGERNPNSSSVFGTIKICAQCATNHLNPCPPPPPAQAARPPRAARKP